MSIKIKITNYFKYEYVCERNIIWEKRDLS